MDPNRPPLSRTNRIRRGLTSVALVLLVAWSIGLKLGAGGEPLREPATVASRDGVLELTLQAGQSTVRLAGRRVTVPAYNGSYLPPTLRVRPGDVIRLRLVNRLGENTNLHTHGLAVSPGATSDDSYRHVYAGQTASYEIRIPRDHASGLFWYHPHPHGLSDVQVRAGMSGALIVEGLLDSIHALRGIRERLLLLKATQVEHGRFEILGIGKHAVRTINGQETPVIAIRPGDTELWRIANVTADLYYRLSLDGHDFGVVARDGHLLPRIEWVDTLVLSPAARAEVLVRGRAAGTYVFRTADVNTGPGGNRYAGEALASVVVSGPPVAPRALPTALRPVDDLRAKVTARRTIVYTESADGDTFFIDRKKFDPSRTDVRVALGAVEEWTIRNETNESHNFHIHQTPFQVTAVNGVPRPPDGLRDVVDVPIGGEVKVVIPFTNPVIVGRFPYHCHLLSHEDKGMMATIEVMKARPRVR
jgi:FtsP/CotA-like multicopper oxidase with cupredoxin domain